MLERSRPGERTVFGHVADEQGCDPEILGEPLQPLRTVAHLRDRSGTAGRVGIRDGLDRVDGDHRGPGRLGVGTRVGKRRFGDHEEILGQRPEAVGAHPDLGGRLLGAHEEATDAVGGHRPQRLQHQRALAHAGLAADERH